MGWMHQSALILFVAKYVNKLITHILFWYVKS